MVRPIAVASVVMLYATVSCSKSTDNADSPTNMSEAEIATSFTAFAAKFHKRVSENRPVIVDADDAKPEGSARAEISPTYNVDVRKTDSLISPYVGTIVFRALCDYQVLNDTRATWRVKQTLNFGWQIGKWTLTSGHYDEVHSDWSGTSERDGKYINSDEYRMAAKLSQ